LPDLVVGYPVLAAIRTEDAEYYFSGHFSSPSFLEKIGTGKNRP
jgi:hypothetical protein